MSLIDAADSGLELDVEEEDGGVGDSDEGGARESNDPLVGRIAAEIASSFPIEGLDSID